MSVSPGTDGGRAQVGLSFAQARAVGLRSLAACDEQQASDTTTTEPMQQQGAVPPADSSGSPSPMAPQGSEPPAAQPPAGLGHAEAIALEDVAQMRPRRRIRLDDEYLRHVG